MRELQQDVFFFLEGTCFFFLWGGGRELRFGCLVGEGFFRKRSTFWPVDFCKE